MLIHPRILHRRQSGAEDLRSHRFLASDYRLNYSSCDQQQLGLLRCPCSGWNRSWSLTNCCAVAHYRIDTSTPTTGLYWSIQRALVHRVDHVSCYWFCWTHDCRELVMETPLPSAGVLPGPSIDRAMLCSREPKMVGVSGQERGGNGYTGKIPCQWR